VSGESREELGPYLVYEQLGSGGMATVHRAEQRGIAGFRRVVALKRLHANVAADPELLKSFIHEARLASHLKHTNVAQTFELGKVGETYFIAMEFVAGPTLGQLMRQCAAAAGPIPLGIVLSIVIQICDALDHAHNLCDPQGRPLGIIHRDVTPANIIISETGLLKLIDFGLAKAQVTSEHTAVGVIKGKYGYVAPEYLGGKLDHRADLWAAGIIMYELLTNRRLFDGPDAFQTMMRVRQLPIPRPSLANPGVTQALDQIVLTALERDPRRRWQSAAAMRDGIRAVIAQPGNAIDNQGVIDWLRGVLQQKRGRAPKLTPMVPMPILAAALAETGPRADWVAVDPAAVVRLDPAAAAVAAEEEATTATPPLVGEFAWTLPMTWTRPVIVWLACASAIALLILGSIIWKIVA